MKTWTEQLKNEDYHGRTDFVSASMVKQFMESRREFESLYVKKEPPEAKKSLELGTVAHALILEPHKLDGVVKEIPAKVLAKNGAKSGNAWKEYAAENADCILLKADEMEQVRAMFDSVYSNPKAAKLLKAKGPTEHSIFGEDGDSRYRVRIDHLAGKFIVDLKTSADPSPVGFQRTMRNFRYYVSAYLYKLLCDEHYGEEHTPVFVAVNSSKPYQCGVYTIEDDWLWRGQTELNDAMNRIAECRQSNDWREPWEKDVNVLPAPKYWRESNDD